MELWIRSQEKKEILKCVNIYYHEPTEKEHYIMTASVEAGRSILGEYSSKERALEVLDKIHNLIDDKDRPYEYFGITKVYEMPKD